MSQQVLNETRKIRSTLICPILQTFSHQFKTGFQQQIRNYPFVHSISNLVPGSHKISKKNFVLSFTIWFISKFWFQKNIHFHFPRLISTFRAEKNPYRPPSQPPNPRPSFCRYIFTSKGQKSPQLSAFNSIENSTNLKLNSFSSIFLPVSSISTPPPKIWFSKPICR